ncbi:MAG: PD40 domain-containing protein [Polyangiaceae bacterium]|nr:PD40 domain-containing protein [Polyangiaceae bacterium]
MKHALPLVALWVCIVGVAAACSASQKGSGSGGSGADATTDTGSTTTTGTGGAGTGGTGAGATGAAGAGGSTTTGTTTSTTTGGPIDFGGGWQIPDAGSHPPLVGNGGTTVVIGPGADASSPGKFGGADNPSGKPTVVYPPDGAILPPNTNALEIHFVPGAGQTLFELAFHAPTNNLVVYTSCTPLAGGCVYTPAASFWNEIVAYARGTAPVTYTVRGVNGQSPGPVGTAQASIAFGEQDLNGGIYYWDTNGIVQRYDFGFPNAPPQQYLTGPEVGAFACVGCHVMSREGTRLAVGQDIPSPAPFKVYRTLTKAPLVANGQPVGGSANFFSFSPDENYLLTSDGVSIRWLDLGTGLVAPAPVVASGTMPDWSPDGLHMVYAEPETPAFFAMPGVSSASIVSLHFNGVGWDTKTTLVPFAGQNNYYPAYAPDGDWVVFNRSPSNSESFSNAAPDPQNGTVPDGELWAVSANGGAPVRLARGSDPGACSWPKWAPVRHDYYGGQILWLTVASARAYGLRLADGQKTQIWMMAFDPARAASAQDPSFPAFWLPFQSMTSGNHIAQWATTVPRKPCAVPADCDAGETCVAGDCRPI